MGLRKNRETFFRRRRVVFTDRDELAFSRVLREFSPSVMIGGGELLPSIAHAGSMEVSTSMPSPSQERRWQINLDMRTYLIRPICHFDYHRSYWEWPDSMKKWAFDRPLLGWGEFCANFPAEDEEMKKFALGVFRLVTKITWKSTPFGMDACLWSQSGGDVRRGLGDGTRIDPDEKIKFNKYYDDSLWDDVLPSESSREDTEFSLY